MGVKADGAEGQQPYHLHVPIVMKSGNLKLLETSGPVRACSGIALTFAVVVVFADVSDADVACVLLMFLMRLLLLITVMSVFIVTCF